MSSDISKLYGFLLDWIDLVDLDQDDTDPELGLRALNKRYATLERKVFGDTTGIIKSREGLLYDLTRNAILGMKIGDDKQLRASNALYIFRNIPVPSDYDPHHQYI